MKPLSIDQLAYYLYIRSLIPENAREQIDRLASYAMSENEKAEKQDSTTEDDKDDDI